jgi:glycosyltransferase involved in cell wall biosynthesis
MGKNVMRLLICTQKVSIDDDVLGFMHGWLKQFAEVCESVEVICLEKGRYELPENVSVHSLGKESVPHHMPIYRHMVVRVLYVVRFYRCVLKVRGRYDAVLVHMNPEYMLLGGLWWRLSGVPIGLWYNHKMGGVRARSGITLAKHVFYTSPFAFAARFKKATRMPAGIDTEQFTPDYSHRRQNAILSLGRIDPVKKLEVLVEALQKLTDQGISFAARFYGNPTSDRSYFERLKKKAEQLVTQGAVRFLPAVPNARAAAVYNEHAIFVNATSAGSFDKSVLEAAACEVPVLSCNPSFRGLLPDELLFREGDSADLAEKLAALLSKSNEELRELGRVLRQAVIREQSLSLLVPRVLATLRA